MDHRPGEVNLHLQYSTPTLELSLTHYSQSFYVTRVIPLSNHLEEASSWNKYLGLVLHHEEFRIVRISEKLKLKTALEVLKPNQHIERNKTP